MGWGRNNPIESYVIHPEILQHTSLLQLSHILQQPRETDLKTNCTNAQIQDLFNGFTQYFSTGTKARRMNANGLTLEVSSIYTE